MANIDYATILRGMERDAGRTLTAEEIVQHASDPDHPLHPYFEWDNDTAGHRWRVSQARQLMYRVRVDVIAVGDLTPRSIPGYVRDPDVDQREQGMVSSELIINDPRRRNAVIERELQRLEAYLARVQGLAIALDCANDFNAVLKRWRIRAGAVPVATQRDADRDLVDATV